MSDQHPNPQIPVFHSPFEHRLSHFSDQFNVAGPVKILTIGSSSTAGEGGIAPYPCRLELALRDPNSWPQQGADRFKGRMIDVINRGKGGGEAPGERDRLQTDVPQLDRVARSKKLSKPYPICLRPGYHNQRRCEGRNYC
jgi:hypothetical protein